MEELQAVPPEIGPLCKCVNCGFAAKRTKLPTAEHPNRFYVEISAKERRGGIEFPFSKTDFYPGGTGGTELACFRGVVDLAEIAERRHRFEGDTDRQAICMAILRDERHCDKSYGHIDGLTPKEHLQQIMWEELEKQRRAFAVETSKQNNRLIIAALILGLFQLVAAILSMGPDALLAKIFHKNAPIIEQPAQQQPAEQSK